MQLKAPAPFFHDEQAEIVGSLSAKVSEALDEMPRTVNEVYVRAGCCGVRGRHEGMVKKGLVKKARIAGRVRHWLA